MMDGQGGVRLLGQRLEKDRKRCGARVGAW